MIDDDFINRNNARKRLDEFIDSLEVKYLKTGEQLFSFGEKSDKLYVLAHGQIGIIGEDGRDHGTQEKGGIIGRYGFFNNKTRSANAKALKPSKLFFMVSLLFNIMYVLIHYSLSTIII